MSGETNSFNTVIERPEIRSIGAYDFPSRSAQALYGDDQLVHVWYDGNPWFVAAACFRAPKAMPFGDFWAALVLPYHEEDPHWQAWWTPVGRGWPPSSKACGATHAGNRSTLPDASGATKMQTSVKGT